LPVAGKTFMQSEHASQNANEPNALNIGRFAHFLNSEEICERFGKLIMVFWQVQAFLLNRLQGFKNYFSG